MMVDVDDKEVLKSGKKPADPLLRWQDQHEL